MESGSRPPIASEAAGRINQYAVVAYIDGKLGEFLYRLRQEIVPDCKLRSHISILPPRPITGDEHTAAEFVRNSSRHEPAFEVALTKIQVFGTTNVIYIEIGRGKADLHRMHGKFNDGALRYLEPFDFHPHITLAQQISESEHEGARQLCEARWAEYAGPRAFAVETLTFVQNTTNCGWIDLAEAHLEMAGTRR